MNKILIVDANKKDQVRLQQILEPFLLGGGEILFAESRESGLRIVDSERPNVVFLDLALLGENEEAWVKEGVHIVLMQEKGSKEQVSEDVLIKPIQSEQVLEKCRGLLDTVPSPEIPPM